MTCAATTDRGGDRLRHGTVYANMRWRDENIRAAAAHRAWAIVRTEGAWLAYQDAISLEQETWLSYVNLAQRLGDHAHAGCDRVWMSAPFPAMALGSLHWETGAGGRAR